MPRQHDMIVENMLEDGLNGNANIYTNIDGSDNVGVDNSDQYKDENNHKPQYVYVDCDRNLNIRCVGADFEVINVFHSYIYVCLCVFDVISLAI